jgi:hypothetical protein
LNKHLNVGLGLQALQSTYTGLGSVIGTSFSSTLLQPERRNGYTDQHALVDDTTSNNNEIDDFIAAIWRQTWADFATDPTNMDHAEDFCTATINTTTVIEQPIMDVVIVTPQLTTATTTSSSSVILYSSFCDGGYSDVQTSRTTDSDQVEN